MSDKSQSMQSGMESAVGKASEGTQQAAAAAMDKAHDLASTAGKKMDEATSALGERVKSVAGSLRERGPSEGMLGNASGMVADSLDNAGRYLQEEGIVGMAEDVTELIRRNPIPAMLVGVGIGYMLAKLFRS
ncbi:MAG TPA: hypothetical protein VN688_07245 [Gemmataceae bacterium]|nr:hypothetical protein [Gemmataceae bacterium]